MENKLPTNFTDQFNFFKLFSMFRKIDAEKKRSILFEPKTGIPTPNGIHLSLVFGISLFIYLSMLILPAISIYVRGMQFIDNPLITLYITAIVLSPLLLYVFLEMFISLSIVTILSFMLGLKANSKIKFWAISFGSHILIFTTIVLVLILFLEPNKFQTDKNLSLALLIFNFVFLSPTIISFLTLSFWSWKYRSFPNANNQALISDEENILDIHLTDGDNTN